MKPGDTVAGIKRRIRTAVREHVGRRRIEVGHKLHIPSDRLTWDSRDPSDGVDMDLWELWPLDCLKRADFDSLPDGGELDLYLYHVGDSGGMDCNMQVRFEGGEPVAVAFDDDLWTRLEVTYDHSD